MLEELTLAIDEKSGDYTRLTRFKPGADTASFGAKSHDYPEIIFGRKEGYMTRLLISGWKRENMPVDRQVRFTVHLSRQRMHRARSVLS